MRVTFYLPEKYLPGGPDQEAWKSGSIRNLEESGKIACAQCWIYQTWVALEAAGVPCGLSSEIPADGILLALSGFFNDSWRPPKGVFFADIVADFLPHPAAHLHIVQNRAHAGRLPRSVFMPLWTQPNLVPRDPARGAVFENVCFLGDPCNLAPALRESAWLERLRSIPSLRLDVRRADRWHDYSDVDCSLAIRDFSRSRQLHKPATKLYNAWLAGVPFIGGNDSAYAADGRSGADYLKAASPEEVLAHLQRLREDPTFRSALVANGRKSGKEFTREKTLHRWERLVKETLPELAGRFATTALPGKFLFEATQFAIAHLDRRVR
ncbi:MAG: glycosyltransferase [Verrucomicrobia bacterium]|nr:glycosyltransferase [Verrucomicrobiota bacterium]